MLGKAVDECVGKTVDAVLAKGGIALITADHGNADKMMEEDGSPFTAHKPTLYLFLLSQAQVMFLSERAAFLLTFHQQCSNSWVWSSKRNDR